MRSTPALRTLAAALLTGGTLAAAATATTAAAAPPTHAEGHDNGNGNGNGGTVRGTVVSRTDLTLRQAPTTHAPAAGSLAPGSHDRVQCMVRGQSVNGNSNWYWLVGARAWAAAAFVDTGSARVPTCADPCPQWKDDAWTNWNDPLWNDAWGSRANSSWSVTVSGSISISGSWSGSSSGASSDGWEWVPIVR